MMRRHARADAQIAKEPLRLISHIWRSGVDQEAVDEIDSGPVDPPTADGPRHAEIADVVVGKGMDHSPHVTGPSGAARPPSGCGWPLWAVEGNVESDDEQLALWARADAHVPDVANPELRLNGFKEDGDIGSKPINAIAGSLEKAWNVGAPVVANLPEAVERQTRFDNAVPEPRPCASLHLQRVAAGDVDAALAEIQVVTCKGGEKGGPVSIGEDCAPGGELVRNVTRAHAAASR